MPWISITAEDLNAAKLAPLITALRTAALADGQGDPVDSITTGVISRVRRMIAACRTNQVDADTSKIPESLKELVCRLIIIAAKNRLEIPLTDDERKQWDIDERELGAISKCELPIEISDNSEAPAVQSTQPSPRITARCRRFGWEQQDGA